MALRRGFTYGLMKNFLLTVSICLAVTSLSGCASIAESTNTLTDVQILSQTSGALGYTKSDLTITNRHTEGTNTYVNLIAANKKEFTCIINGGNILTLGMSNPPQCAKKGDPINTTPFQH